jgi:GDPmannose 4,6-dehydratase
VTASPRALVIGVAGQDGSYLADLLLERGYDVVGIVRGEPEGEFPNISHIRGRITLVRADLADTESIIEAVAAYEPTELYNFAGVSFGPDAWADPARTVELGGLALARLLEGIRPLRNPPRVLQASSSWVFGRPQEAPQSESTPYAPVEPYGAAKALGDFVLRSYRERYGLFACSAIFYNHESPRRAERFASRKITRAAASIAHGVSDRIVLGDLDAKRDWGFAPDFVRAAWLMLQADAPADYVIASGELHSVREWALLAFAAAGLEFERHVSIDPELIRTKGQVANLVGDATAAQNALGWSPTVGFDELVRTMVDADLATLSTGSPTSPEGTQIPPAQDDRARSHPRE